MCIRDRQKLKEGTDLIRYFCTLAKQKDGTLCRHLPADDPQRWEALKSYNLRDVETEMGIQKRLSKFPVPDAEWENYLLDQQINDQMCIRDSSQPPYYQMEALIVYFNTVCLLLNFIRWHFRL